MAHELREFLASLAKDETVTKFNEMTVDAAREYLADAGLNAAQQDAVLNHDITAICHELTLEDKCEGEFIIAAGPTMKGPAKFTAKLHGTISPMQGTMSARQGTMDPQSPGASARQQPAPGSKDDQGKPPKA